jgi:tetratricopeptide (TPR) repeat protein
VDLDMNVDQRKILTLAVPVVIGLTTLLILNGLNSRRTAPARESSAKASEPQTAAPDNPAHERAALEEQLKLNPDHPPILLRLAEIEKKAGETPKAIAYLKRALAQDPKNEDARLELGRALYESGDVDGAIRETKQLLADYPHDVDGLYNLGAIYANLSRNDVAREYWSHAVAEGPGSDSGRRAKDALGQLAK